MMPLIVSIVYSMLDLNRYCCLLNSMCECLSFTVFLSDLSMSIFQIVILLLSAVQLEITKINNDPKGTCTTRTSNISMTSFTCDGGPPLFKILLGSCVA